MYSLRKTGLFIEIARKAVLKRSCSGIESDVLLQNQYIGFFPRIMSLWSLTEEKGMEQFSKLFTNKVVAAERPLMAIWLYTDLQNPLLQKYKFDAHDFVRGATHAYAQVVPAISSVNFSNFSNGFAAQSDDHALLCNVLHPSIYRACIDAAKSLHKSGISTTMTGNEVSSVIITRVKTVVVTAELLRERQQTASESNKDDEDKENVVVEVTKEPTNTDTPTKKEREEEVEKEKDVKGNGDSTVVQTSTEIGTTVTPVITGDTVDGEKDGHRHKDAVEGDAGPAPAEETYPEGAVLATVDVLCESTEKYQTRFKDGDDVQSERVNVSTWSFRGCISGHVELSWKIVAFDGLGSKEF